jgi:hypothetical protein
MLSVYITRQRLNSNVTVTHSIPFIYMLDFSIFLLDADKDKQEVGEFYFIFFNFNAIQREA